VSQFIDTFPFPLLFSIQSQSHSAAKALACELLSLFPQPFSNITPVLQGGVEMKSSTNSAEITVAFLPKKMHDRATGFAKHGS
jgi:hypothetical protein